MVNIIKICLFISLAILSINIASADRFSFGFEVPGFNDYSNVIWVPGHWEYGYWVPGQYVRTYGPGGGGYFYYDNRARHHHYWRY